MISSSFYKIISKKFTLIIAITAAMTSSVWASGLLLYAPFQQDATPIVSNGNAKPAYNENVQISSGKFGGAASVVARQSQLVFDGPGNIYSQAGTVSFFWRLDVDPAGQNVTILNLSPLEKTDKERYILLSYVAGKFRVYLSAGNTGGQTLTSQSILIVPGQWYHVALCWDQTQGLALYVDGDQALQFSKPWIYQGAIGGIGFGIANQPGRAPLTPFSESYDEFRVYDRWLDDAAIEQLKQGKAATLSALNVASFDVQRNKLFQWNDVNIGKMPQLKVGIGGGIGLRQANIESGQSTIPVPFGGKLAASWPADSITAPQNLDVTMQKNQPFDVVQMLGTGRLTLVDKETNKTLLDFNSGDITYRDYILQSPVSAQQLSLQATPLVDDKTKKPLLSAAYNLQFFKQIRYPYEFDKTWQKVSLRAGTDADQSLDTLLNIRQAFYSSDQQTFITQDGASTGQITIPALHTFHVVGPTPSQNQGLNAIALELNLLPRTPGFLRIQITDPQNPMQFLTSVDVHLNGGQGMLRLLLDHRDMNLPSGARPVISLTFSDDTTIDLANSSVRFQWRN